MDHKPVAIVTGASKGIGAAIARQLSQTGYRLVLMSRSGCADISEELGAIGVAGSVLEDEDIAAVVETAKKEFGRIDAAVYCGGRHAQVMAKHDLPEGPALTGKSFGFDPDYKPALFDTPWAAWHDTFEMMVIGAMRLTKAVLPTMQAQKSGSIVAISGIEGAQPRLIFPMGPVRLALGGYVKLIADRYGPEGIRMNAVASGMLDNAGTDFPDEWMADVPLNRWGSVDEIGHTVAFLASPGAGYITGQTITADGGVNRGVSL